MNKLAVIAALGIFSVCSSLPVCGTYEAKGKTCRQSFWEALAEHQATQPPPRDYIKNPILPPPPLPTTPAAVPQPKKTVQNCVTISGIQFCD